MEPAHEYSVLLSRTTGEDLAEVPVRVDLSPARQWGLFEGFRHGGDGRREAAVEPAWSDEHGPPLVQGLRVRSGGGSFDGVLDITYFARCATRASAELVRKGTLTEGEKFHYRVLARPGSRGDDQVGPARRVRTSRTSRLPPCVESSVEGFLARATVAADGQPEDHPVFIDRQVLCRIESLTRSAGSAETGGFLLGRLHRDGAGGEVFLDIDDHLPAEHTRRELTRLTLTHETWQALREELDGRRDGRRVVGWWHCHNYLHDLCGECEKAKQGDCRANAAFFSQDDVALHRRCFPAAFTVALVTADNPCLGLTRELFGWRRGLVQGRGYHLLDGPASCAVSMQSEPKGETHDAPV
jgi:hypothetical protein